MMRRIFFTIAILLFSWNVFSQGIQFEIGSWKEVLQKAKQENKLIFVDLYTTWCGPCKKMEITSTRISSITRLMRRKVKDRN